MESNKQNISESNKQIEATEFTAQKDENDLIPSDKNQPAQSGRESSASGSVSGILGNLPPMQDRPFTPVGVPGGKSRNPNNQKN